VKVSVSVMAHPDRLFRVSALRESLGIGPLSVAWDEEGPPTRDPERIWRTARAAWRLHDPAADWHLLLQDDALPVPGLAGMLPGMLAHVPPGAVVSLYLGTGRPVPGIWHELGRRADEAGAAWIVGPRVMWGVALAVPTSLIPDMIRWGDTQRGIPDDMRVGRWAARRKLEAWFPWPSLVNHPEGDSLINHGAGRTARRVLDREAASVDYGGPVVRWGRA
jgi:hypothetical protein